MSGRLYCLASTESKSCLSSATSASAISVFTRLLDKSVKLVLQTTLPVLPAITRQPEFRWFVVRDSCEALRLHQRLVVDHDELALVRPAVPLQEDPRALVAQQPQLRAAVGGRAVVGHLQLAPARPVLRQEEIVREVGGVGHGERVGGEELRSCGAETVPELVTSPQTTLPVDTPPLVAVKVQSKLSQSSGPVEAAPVMVSVAPVSAPVAAKLAAVAAPEAVSVPVDTSRTVVKFPALAVLLMVRVLPVIPVAELSRPTLAAPLMLSELPDTAPVDVSVAPATVPVAVSAAPRPW